LKARKSQDHQSWLPIG